MWKCYKQVKEKGKGRREECLRNARAGNSQAYAKNHMSALLKKVDLSLFYEKYKNDETGAR